MTSRFDPHSIQCPHCQNGILRAINDNEKIVSFFCSGSCGSKFKSDYFVDYNHGKVYHLAKRINPDHLSQLEKEVISEDFSEYLSSYLEKSEKLELKGISFYAETYVIGCDDFIV